MTRKCFSSDSNASVRNNLRNADIDEIFRHFDSHVTQPTQEATTSTTTTSSETTINETLLSPPSVEEIRQEMSKMREKMNFLESYISEMRNQMNSLDECLSDYNTTDTILTPVFQSVSTKSVNIEIPSSADNADFEDNNDDVEEESFNKIENVLGDIIEVSEDDDKGPKMKPNIYNTGGIYMHAVLATCYFRLGTIRSILVAITSLAFTFLQIVILEMITTDSYDRIITKESEELCQVLRLRQTIIFFFMTILFSCILYQDVKESVVEEAMLNHAVTHRKENISSIRAVEVLRLCLHIRRFIIPWRMVQAAVFTTLQEDVLSTNEIILNFLSIGFISEADNLLGAYFFSENNNKIADKIVTDVIEDFDDEDFNMNVDVKNFRVPRALAILPTFIVGITSIVFMQQDSCIKSLLRFHMVFGKSILPSTTIFLHGIEFFIFSKHAISFFERYTNAMGELMLNLAGFSLYIVVAISENPDVFSSMLLRNTFIVSIICFVILYLCRDYYINHIIDRERKPGQVIFCVLCFIVVGAALSAMLFFGSIRYHDRSETMG